MGGGHWQGKKQEGTHVSAPCLLLAHDHISIWCPPGLVQWWFVVGIPQVSSLHQPIKAGRLSCGSGNTLARTDLFRTNNIHFVCLMVSFSFCDLCFSFSVCNSDNAIGGPHCLLIIRHAYCMSVHAQRIMFLVAQIQQDD